MQIFYLWVVIALDRMTCIGLMGSLMGLEGSSGLSVI